MDNFSHIFYELYNSVGWMFLVEDILVLDLKWFYFIFFICRLSVSTSNDLLALAYFSVIPYLTSSVICHIENLLKWFPKYHMANMLVQ